MLINKKAVKIYALGVAAGRAHKFTRVSNSFLLSIEYATKTAIEKSIQSLPSKGKTIK